MKLSAITILWGCLVFALYGCDQAADLLGKDGSESQAEAETPDEGQYDRDYLMGLLDDQEELAVQIKDAKNIGDLATAKSLFAEFEAMDASFKSEFDSLQDRLSGAARNELSRRRAQIMRLLN